MDELEFLVDKSISISKRLYLYVIIQYELLWNKKEGRDPGLFEKYEAKILASFIALIHLKNSFPDLYSEFEKCIYYELRSENNPDIRNQLRKINEEHNFINNRFYLIDRYLFNRENNSENIILDKLYLNPLSESGKISASFENPIIYLELLTLLGIGSKYLNTTLDKAIPQFLFLSNEEKPKINLSKLSSGWSLMAAELDAALSSISVQNLTLRYKLYPISTTNPGFSVRFCFSINRVMINYSQGYSSYLKIYKNGRAIFFICFGYPIINDLNDWFCIENSNVYLGQVDLNDYEDSFKIEFNLGTSKLFLEGGIIENTLSCFISKEKGVRENIEMIFEESDKFILKESKANYVKAYVAGVFQYVRIPW